MDRLFLDTNVLFSAASRAESGVGRLWEVGEATLLSSTYAVHEARRNLDSSERSERLERLLADVGLVSDVVLPADIAEGVALPRKDRPILAGALAAGATHLITGDVRDFGRWFGQELYGILVLPPGRYLRTRERASGS